MNKQLTGKVLISIAVALSAIVSTFVDLLPGATGHVYYASWPAHAIFHDIVMFLLLDFMALVCLWLLWRKSSEPLVAVKVATLLVVGFWTPFYYVSSLFPMASLATNQEEMALVSIVVGGMRLYFNVLIGTAMVVIALIGYWLYRGASVTGKSNAWCSNKWRIVPAVAYPWSGFCAKLSFGAFGSSRLRPYPTFPSGRPLDRWGTLVH